MLCFSSAMECLLSPMASSPPLHNPRPISRFITLSQRNLPISLRGNVSLLTLNRFLRSSSRSRRNRVLVVCSMPPDESSSRAPKISSAAKIRSEVISPFRSVRIFFYLAFIASASIGALTSLPRLIAAIGHAPNASPTMEVLSGLGVDLGAVLVFALLYRADVKAQDLQIARLSREETLAGLKIELSNKKVLTLEQTRGAARLVIVAGTSSHIEEACRRSQQYFLPLLERGVVVVYFATDGQVPNLEFSADVPLSLQDQNENKEENLDSINKEEVRVEKLWRGRPIYTSEWFRWLNDQKKIANVPDDSPVYLSLRLDGRVRGSGKGFPPWGALVAQLPPLKGIWKGVLDGMDGRV